MNERECEGRLWRPSRLRPDTKAIKAPGRRPTHERPEDQSIGQPTSNAKAHLVVIPGKKAEAALRWNVTPVSRALIDERFWIGGGEPERRRCITDSRSTLADALASTLNVETEADARLVKELLRLSGT